MFQCPVLSSAPQNRMKTINLYKFRQEIIPGVGKYYAHSCSLQCHFVKKTSCCRAVRHLRTLNLLLPSPPTWADLLPQRWMLWALWCVCFLTFLLAQWFPVSEEGCPCLLGSGKVGTEWLGDSGLELVCFEFTLPFGVLAFHIGLDLIKVLLCLKTDVYRQLA